MKIYTRTGTAARDAVRRGTRIGKSDPRVDAYGEVAKQRGRGRARREAGVDKDSKNAGRAPTRSVALGSRLADRRAHCRRVTKIAPRPDGRGAPRRLIDRCEEELTPLRRFILPGGTPAAAALHLRVRCAGARAAHGGSGGAEVRFLAYMNRLSDLLFVLAAS